MKKEDYMRLPKERLAELLEERDNEQKYAPSLAPIQVTMPELPCYAEGGICTNPHHDCVNCPRHGTGGFWTTGTSTAEIK
jgi:hypothetical protein